MKITVTPGHITGARFDDVTAAAIMKMHKPRAAKLASAKNLLSLLTQHYGTARRVTDVTYGTDRWLDCNPDVTNQINPVAQPGDDVVLKSSVGILTVENTVNGGAEYPIGYQNITLYVPLDPAASVRVYYAGRGMYPHWDVPAIVYYVEFA